MGTEHGTIEPAKVTSDGDTGLGRPWQVVVRNDDHNTFPHVIALFCRVLPGVSAQRAESLAWHIHRTGRGVVWTGHREPAELYAELLAEGGLLATCEPSP